MAKNPRAKPDPLDRRRLLRVPTKIAATALLESGDRLSCMIRDQSEGGARLVLKGADRLDPEFTLLEHAGNKTRRVRVVWADSGQAGVAYVGEG